MVFKHKRTQNLQVRLTVQEKEDLELEARLAGFCLSDFIRQLIYYKREKTTMNQTNDVQERGIQTYLRRTR